MKIKQWTVEEFKARTPCSDGAAFARLHKHDWPKIWDACERGDWLIWWLRNARALDKTLSVRIAVACAERALPNYERRKPGDARPRNAIDAAKGWLANPCEETRKNAAYAAAAYAAAYAAADADADADAYAYADAYAAYAAAYAAAAADAYSDAAADAYAAAAYAYAYAAYADADAAARRAERKWQADKIRELVGDVEWTA